MRWIKGYTFGKPSEVDYIANKFVQILHIRNSNFQLSMYDTVDDDIDSSTALLSLMFEENVA